VADSFLKKTFKLFVIWIAGYLISIPAALMMLFVLDELPQGFESYSFLIFTLVFAFTSGLAAYYWIKETRTGKVLFAIVSATLFIAPRISLLMYGLA